MKDDEEQTEEARRALGALSRGAGLLGAARMRDDANEEADAVEIWAKRIGRALGLIFVALLAINLFTGWFF